MSNAKISRYSRDVSITMSTSTATSQMIRLDDMAGGIVSFGTMSTNAASIQMFGSIEPSGPYRRIYNSDGSQANITLSPSSTEGRIYSLPDAVFGVAYLMLVSGTTNSVGTSGLVNLKS